jgi:hypothetical protein
MLSGYATGWRIEDYVPDQLMIWFVDYANCGTSGGVSFPTNAVDVDRNRFIALVASAKAGASQMFLRYNVSNGTCTVVSFGFLE